MESLYRIPVTYVLVMRLVHSRRLTVGRPGRFRLEAGWYGNVGGTSGPGGIGARLERHLRRDKSSHWQIDYLRPATESDQ